MRCYLLGVKLSWSLGKRGTVICYIALDNRNGGNCVFHKGIFVCTKFWNFLALNSGKGFPFSLVRRRVTD